MRGSTFGLIALSMLIAVAAVAGYQFKGQNFSSFQSSQTPASVASPQPQATQTPAAAAASKSDAESVAAQEQVENAGSGEAAVDVALQSADKSFDDAVVSDYDTVDLSDDELGL